jgi:lipopolysaccharide transport system ATP-binding protein
MSENAIEVHNLGKKYHISKKAESSDTLISSLGRFFTSPFRRAGKLLRGQQTGAAELDQEFWALKDINFEVKHGEVLGIIGRNGAGKSTLLKVLSRITEPSEGYARINGRIGSLLEVGTGFHLELTGRENIYLNGSILGMSHAEITDKYDEIVTFSEIGDFIDTPVKHYSSGMKVRLAFAVAAHLDPEILLIDEVLAVGDYAFQKKSLGKMQEVTHSNRTVIFVSHQLDMIRSICDRVILLNDGGIEMVGDPDEVLDTYIKSFGQDGGKTSFSCEEEPERPYQILSGRILNQDGEQTSIFDMFEPITVELDYVIREPVEGINVRLLISRNSAPIFLSFDNDTEPTRLDCRQQGTYHTYVKLPTPLLKSGSYTVIVAIGLINNIGMEHIHLIKDELSFDVHLKTQPRSLHSYSPKRQGLIATALDWQLNKLD